MVGGDLVAKCAELAVVVKCAAVLAVRVVLPDRLELRGDEFALEFGPDRNCALV